MRRISAYLLASVPVVLLAGCATFEPPAERAILETALPHIESVPDAWMAEGAWAGEVDPSWLQALAAPGLEAYVSEVLENNPSLAIAEYRVEAAAAVARQASGQLQPSLGVGASGIVLDGIGSGVSTSLGADVMGSWTIDIFGKLRSAKLAAEAGLRRSEAEFQQARLSLVGAAAKAWMDAAESVQVRDFIEEVFLNQEETLRIVRLKVEEGSQTEKELRLAEAQVSGARAQLANAQMRVALASRVLDILAGRYPSGNTSFHVSTPSRLASTPTGIPAELLERRYDIVAAREAVVATFHLLEEAKVARLPSLELTGAGIYSGADSLALLGIKDSILGGMASLTAPIFAGGQLKEQVQVRTAEQEQAIALYGDVVLQAFLEVESSLEKSRWLEVRIDAFASLVEQISRARDLAGIQYEGGQIDLLSVLQLEDRVIEQRIQEISARYAAWRNRIDLHIALGGAF
ncbi:efflux transporter outer membrane subunit [Pelagicoccus albus]|uniref:TolC family protein n=1 Tax=Pelagicoccus albus TaxID=415222 RepID=A0A7X1BBE5_9BACT|nr:TolC family protein [Pelagicoccus albus]MBC2607860.1 TolC family protein [Pelagicoccus albus]